MPKLPRLLQAVTLCLFLCTTVSATVSVSPLFTDHMVLQRNAPIHIWGKSTPNETLTISFAGKTVTTHAVKGEWEIRFPSMPAGGPYTLEIKASNTLIVRDILIGDVWVCAGQSNMRFRVNQSFDADMALLQSKNDQLRLSDWEGTLNPINQRYPLSFLRSLTTANFYTTKEWKTSDSASVAAFSAVGYFFGNTVQQSMHIPIGLINNSIGGVPVETYLPFSELASDSILSPLAGTRWLHHPLYPVWTAERVMQNLIAWKEEAPDSPMPAHPYQPGFLFEAAIAPLKKLAIKGVIWYQGESNATFTADSSQMDPSLNKRKLALLINSWRKSFQEPALPFIIIQLPSVKRDWETYREVQSELSKELTHVSTVVTLDLGHATDVHPRNKKTVGERAARAALANVYQQKIIPGGPVVQSFRTEGKQIVISFSNAAAGLSTKDGEQLRRIMICGADRIFYPATVQFKKNELWLSATEVTNPIAARYAWEDDPFDANLINAAGLPASPFRTDKW